MAAPNWDDSYKHCNTVFNLKFAEQSLPLARGFIRAVFLANHLASADN